MEQQGPKKYKRVRRSVKDIYDELGPIYFRRAYRMWYEKVERKVTNHGTCTGHVTSGSG